MDVATLRLPTPACVIRTCRAFHPIGHVRLWFESRRGICSEKFSPLTRFESNGFADFHGKVFPARPNSRVHVHEIESEDYAPTGKVDGLLSEASLELDGP